LKRTGRIPPVTSRALDFTIAGVKSERHAQAVASLRAIALDAGITSLTKLAEVAEVDRVTLRLALRGEREPRPATILRLSHALRVPTSIVAFVFRRARGES